jgi:hypothetical protein
MHNDHMEIISSRFRKSKIKHPHQEVKEEKQSPQILKRVLI